MNWNWLLTRPVPVGKSTSYTDWIAWHYHVLLGHGLN